MVLLCTEVQRYLNLWDVHGVCIYVLVESSARHFDDLSPSILLLVRSNRKQVVSERANDAGAYKLVATSAYTYIQEYFIVSHHYCSTRGKFHP